MRQQRAAGLAVVATVALTLAACSGGNDTGGPGGSGDTTSHSGTPGGGQGSEPGSPQSPSPTAPRPPRTITMVMSGDVLLHEGLWTTAENDAARTGHGVMDFRPVLANMRSVIKNADFAICHMETPVAPVGGPYSAYPIFSVPPQIIPALKWEGYDACTTSSNHSIDKGFEGVQRTIDDFNRIGLAHFGTVVTEEASKHALLIEHGGITLGLIGATYGTNGIPLPADEPWCVPIINPTKIKAMAHEAKANGADIVIVALHWGLEYDHEPISDQTSVADSLMRSPAIDFIYGHHAHVVQPYGQVHGKWVVYGLGNAIAQQETTVEGVYDGNTARVTFTEQPDGSFKMTKLEYIPTMITPFDTADPVGHPMRWLDVPKDLSDPTYASIRPQLLATQERVRSDVNLLGAFKHGVTEGE